MYTYFFDGVRCEIKAKYIEQTASRIVSRNTYPNSLILRMEQEAQRTVIFSNQPLVQNPGGLYTAPIA